MLISLNDLQRLINRETTPEQARRREATLQRAKEVHRRPGVLLKPGVRISDEEAERRRHD